MYLLHVQESMGGGGWVGWLDPKVKMHGRPVVYRRDTAKPSWDPRKGNHGNTSDFFSLQQRSSDIVGLPFRYSERTTCLVVGRQPQPPHEKKWLERHADVRGKGGTSRSWLL